MDNQTVKDRVYKFCEHKNMPIKQFEALCGMSNGYISSMRKGFGTDKLSNVLTAFPELNRDWLLYGEGEMLKGQGGSVSISNVNGDNIGCGHDNTINNNDLTIRALIDQIKVKDGQISKSQDQISMQQAQITKSQEQISKSQEQIDRLIALLEKK